MGPLAEPPAPATSPEWPVVRVPVALVAVAIGLAFADASIVVLALPEIYGTFEVSIVEASWVITSYNVAVVATAVALLLSVRVSPRALTGLGLVVFGVSSVVCGTATSFAVLVGGRVTQGVGGGCLLVGSLPLLATFFRSTSRARSLWSYAAAAGVAVGPGLGGLLTQLLSWRSIFLVQAPVAAVALAGALRPLPARPPPSGHDSWGHDPTNGDQNGWRGGRAFDFRAAVADAAFVLLFAALVGALFLSVLLFVVVWSYSSLQGALVVSVLAVGTIAVWPVGRALPSWVAAATGGWMLTGGLVGLAWLPAAEAGYAAVALAFCGCGFGLVNAVLSGAALPQTERVRRPATVEVGAKHLGIVVGLVAIAPMLAADLDVATGDAEVAATAVVLDAPLGLQLKVPIALDLQKLVADTPRGQVPDVREPFDRRGARENAEVAAVRDDLTDAIEATITRSFRASFLAAALFAAASAIVGVLAALLTGRR